MRVARFEDLPLIPAPAAGRLLGGGEFRPGRRTVVEGEGLARLRGEVEAELATWPEDGGGRIVLAANEPQGGREAYGLRIAAEEILDLQCRRWRSRIGRGLVGEGRCWMWRDTFSPWRR